MGLTDCLEGRKVTTPLYFLGDYINGEADTERIVNAVEYKEDYNSHNGSGLDELGLNEFALDEFALDELKLEDGTQVLDLDKIRIELGNINHEELAEKLRVKDDYNYGIGQSYGAWYIAMAKDPNSSSNQ